MNRTETPSTLTGEELTDLWLLHSGLVDQIADTLNTADSHDEITNVVEEGDEVTFTMHGSRYVATLTINVIAPPQ